MREGVNLTASRRELDDRWVGRGEFDFKQGWRITVGRGGGNLTSRIKEPRPIPFFTPPIFWSSRSRTFLLLANSRSKTNIQKWSR